MCVLMEMFYICSVHYNNHQPSVAGECLKCDKCSGGTEYFNLIHSDLSSHMYGQWPSYWTGQIQSVVQIFKLTIPNNCDTNSKFPCQSQVIYLVHTAREERKTCQKYSTKQLASFQRKVPLAVYLLFSLYHPKRRKCYVTQNKACSSKINHLGQLAGNVQ